MPPNGDQRLQLGRPTLFCARGPPFCYSISSLSFPRRNSIDAPRVSGRSLTGNLRSRWLYDAQRGSLACWRLRQDLLFSSWAAGSPTIEPPEPKRKQPSASSSCTFFASACRCFRSWLEHSPEKPCLLRDRVRASLRRCSATAEMALSTACLLAGW